MRISYHPEAEAELLEAAQYYEEQLPGLGLRFLEEYETAVAMIVDAPDRWQTVESDVKRYIMRRFPYGIYYRIAGGTLRILVVKHHRRHPDYWKDRLEQ